MTEKRVFNFSAGPSTLPVPVLEKAAKQMLNYENSGMSVMEMSHRSSSYLDIFQKTKDLLKKVMNVPDDYKIVFIQGGATQQFSMVPLNLLKNGKADYIITGSFSKKAANEAKKYGEINIAYDGSVNNFKHIPTQDELKLDPEASYVHLCSNNTIYGTEWKYVPETNGVPIIADMSSNILSKPIDVSKYGMIYAGAQKNMGIAGLGVAIIKEELLQKVPAKTPVLLDYQLMIDNDSMYNTPPAYAIYVLGLVLEWIDNLGGLEVMEQRNIKKAKLKKERGKMPTLHMCFNGNPGTGKTSVARIIGKLFSEEKILSGNGEFVEIHGRDLVAKYVGWTAQNVHDIVEKAIGGVLFIDEAYSLISERKGGFEDEAIATLIKEMEDHREEVCIILAGYTEEMKELLKENPGFESRIQFTINFPDYTEEELYEIFTGLCKKEKYRLSNNCKEILLENFRKAKEQECFGNGRYVRNIFEKIKFEQADRIVKANSKNINIITKQDIQNTLNLVRTNSRETRRVIGF